MRPKRVEKGHAFIEAIIPEGKVVLMAVLERHVAGSAPADAATHFTSRGMNAEAGSKIKSKINVGTSTNADTVIDLVAIYDISSSDPTLWKRIRSFPVSMGHVQWKNRDGGLKDACGLVWSLDGSTIAVWDHALEVCSSNVCLIVK